MSTNFNFDELKAFESVYVCFQITRKIVFEVRYTTRNYFATSACEFNQPKTDWDCCGQGQEHLLAHDSKAYEFYKKWDKYHLKELDETLYTELISDIKELIKYYNYGAQTGYDLSFSSEKEISMLPIKKKKILI